MPCPRAVSRSVSRAVDIASERTRSAPRSLLRRRRAESLVVADELGEPGVLGGGECGPPASTPASSASSRERISCAPVQLRSGCGRPAAISGHRGSRARRRSGTATSTTSLNASAPAIRSTAGVDGRGGPCPGSPGARELSMSCSSAASWSVIVGGDAHSVRPRTDRGTRGVGRRSSAVGCPASAALRRCAVPRYPSDSRRSTCRRGGAARSARSHVACRGCCTHSRFRPSRRVTHAAKAQSASGREESDDLGTHARTATGMEITPSL